MTFDPSVYQTKGDLQEEPSLPDDQWIERFVARLKWIGTKCATPDFQRDMDRYARDIAPSYLEDRREYVSPEEAAEADASYWDDEE